MFEFWIELSHLIICYIGVYCGVSVGIWLMVQAIDEVKRIRKKPVVKDCSIDWNYEALYKALKEDYNALKTKYYTALQGEEILQKHFKELQESARNLECENKKLKKEYMEQKDYLVKTSDLDDELDELYKEMFENGG